MARAPLLIALPQGLPLGGVSVFASRLANALAAQGRGVAVVVHPEARGAARAGWGVGWGVGWGAGVEVVRAEGRFEDRPGDLSWCVPVYRDVVRRMAAQSGGPVALAPQGLGDCYGVAAAICAVEPELVRVIGWQHSDIEYDTRVLERYEPIVSRFVAVSDRIEKTLTERMPERAGDVVNVPYGVEVGTLVERARGGPLKLIYCGRLDHEQKRVMALIAMCEELERRGVEHALTVVGDGPAAAEFDRAARGKRIERMGAVGAGEVAGLLRGHEALALPSRYEGLSISMLEAMAAGCVPILARTRSGAGQAVESGYNGEIAEVGTGADEAEVGAAMARAVERLAGRDRGAMARAARETVKERFSIERHVDRVGAMIDESVREPGRWWPGDRACAFSAAAGSDRGSGSVPADGAARMRAVLEGLRGRRVVIHGAGQHTVQLAAVLACSPAEIVAVADDDRARHGSRVCGWEVIDPRRAHEMGATDAVISSWMHEAAVWERRAVYEAQGVRVWRVYGEHASNRSVALKPAERATRA